MPRWKPSARPKATFGTAPFEGHFTTKLEGSWKEERLDIPAGSLIVPIAQPKARLLMTLLEPQCSDSYAAWGFFSTAFEQKEYMEPYVAEDVAKQMLASDPALAEAFKKRLATDAEFAKSPEARLDFFYRRHPSYDSRFNLYPVYRIAEEVKAHHPRAAVRRHSAATVQRLHSRADARAGCQSCKLLIRAPILRAVRSAH